MNDAKLSNAFVDRLHDLWMSMLNAMSQGHDGKIDVNPQMVDDIRAAEFIIRAGVVGPDDGTLRIVPK